MTNTGPRTFGGYEEYPPTYTGQLPPDQETNWNYIPDEGWFLDVEDDEEDDEDYEEEYNPIRTTSVFMFIVARIAAAIAIVMPVILAIAFWGFSFGNLIIGLFFSVVVCLMIVKSHLKHRNGE